MSEKQGIIKAVVVLVVICLVISGALAVVNSFTAPGKRRSKRNGCAAGADSGGGQL